MLQSGSNPTKPGSSLWYYSDLFWVGGLALLSLFLGIMLWGIGLGLEGEKLEWALYLTLATIFPALLLVFSWSTRFLPFAPPLVQRLKLAFVVVFIAASSTLFVVTQNQYYILIISMVYLLLLYTFRRAELVTKPTLVAMGIFVVVISWTVAVRFVWWSPFDAWFLDSRYRILVFILSLLLVFVNLHPKGESESAPGVRLRSILNIAAILIFGMVSVHSGQLFTPAAYLHWGFFAGPAEMVRQGGWLLWDVPSQYGFLSILTIALLPTGTVWQAMYIANSLLLFLSAVFLFFVLRSLRTGFANFCFSFAVTLAAIFLMAGWAPDLTGPFPFPSVAAFRFFWCYGLLSILVWEFQTGSKDPPRWILVVGCITWLIGTLWSAESAVYCAATWLPAYALLVSRKTVNVYGNQGSLKSSLRTTVLWFTIPPLLLLSAMGVIAAYYIVSLGHLPDWSAFFEYAASYSSGFGALALPIEPNGPVWVLFLVFCAFSTTAVYFLRGGFTHRGLGLIAGTWGALWAISSYFVSRSHPNAVTNLSPLLCIAIGVALYLFAHHQKTNRQAMLVRMSFVPILTVLLAATFGNAAGLTNYITSYEGYQRDINSHLPVIDDSLRSLLDRAQVKPEDPIVLYGDFEIFPAWPVSEGSDTHFLSPPRTWLPTMPYQLLEEALPDERKELYVARFIERARLSGWLLEHNNADTAPYSSSAWFANQLQKTHTPTEVFENDDWRLTWFEFSE